MDPHNPGVRDAIDKPFSVRIAGDVSAGQTVSSVDGTSVGRLISGGTVGGEIHQHAEVAPVLVSAFSGVVFESSQPGFESLSWTQWLNAAAPTGSTGLAQSPGCTSAPWSSSDDGRTIVVDRNVAIDARQVTTGCAAVRLQGLTVLLSADLVLYADSIESLSGTKFVSADGGSHRVELLVPGSTVTCGSGVVKLNSNTTTDDHIELRIVTPGQLSVVGHSSLNATADVGCLTATGAVTFSNE